MQNAPMWKMRIFSAVLRTDCVKFMIMEWPMGRDFLTEELMGCRGRTMPHFH